MKDQRQHQEPPLSTRECADFIGCSTDYILKAIKAGKLSAERATMPGNQRAMYRVHVDDFRAFLKAINFKRLPAEAR